MTAATNREVTAERLTALEQRMPLARLVELDHLLIAAIELGHHFALSAPDEDARAAGLPWVAASWLFVEPIGEAAAASSVARREVRAEQAATQRS